MDAQISRPVKEYKEAFMQFTDAEESEFQFKSDRLVLAYYEDTTYRICHYNDLLWEFKTYFQSDYTLIYTETPFDLWVSLFDEHDEITNENLIIDIYNAWKLYWDQQEHKYINKKTMQFSKEQSWRDFSLLIESIKDGPGNIIENAIDLSDITLIPILALAMRMQFENEDEFYHACIDMLIEEFPEDFGVDGNFDEVIVDTGKTAERFFIYTPEYGFEDWL
ncbi:hypothetical protein MTO98_09765 [Mucilaginibacter sp. SMC90]|uniref:hypothetical protein n=1 Tax=Mucilaginibacter sp. SMC90 TaxID=2929803 RepID=UPI001FB3C85F|nr:hypothetical protein [Mucilaginibacter sp. SMC90]UOE51364.1 hypothetical protein MTO98_09765 [Mucilaginibacter sp. SMC90]